MKKLFYIQIFVSIIFILIIVLNNSKKTKVVIPVNLPIEIRCPPGYVLIEKNCQEGDPNIYNNYTNIQYGFTFDYPSTWDTPTTTYNGNILEVYAKEATTVPFIAHYASGMTLSGFITEAYGHSVSDTPQQITVPGQKGYKYTYETSVDGKGNANPLYNQQVAFEDGKGGLFVINYAVRPANKTEGMATFNQILASFKL